MINIPHTILTEFEGEWNSVDSNILRASILEALCKQATEEGFITYMTYAFTDQQAQLKTDDELQLRTFYKEFIKHRPCIPQG